MQFEADHAKEFAKLAEYVDRKEDPLIQVVRTHQHNTNSSVLQTARCLRQKYRKKQEKWTAQRKKQKKDGMGRGCMDNCHVT